MWRPYLVILEPWEVLCRKYEPVFLGSTFHDANVIDGQPTLAYDLHQSRVRSSEGNTADNCSQQGTIHMKAWKAGHTMRADCADENKSKSQTADTGGKK